MPLDVASAVHQFEADLRAAGTPERAANEKRYLKSELEHVGVTLGETRRIAKAFVRQHRDLTHDELVALVTAMWSRGIFECRMVAEILLEAYPDLIEPSDLPFLQELIRTSHTWALVDALAAHVLGTVIIRYPDAAATFDRWAADDDFWVRRAALLSNLLPLKKHNEEFDRFVRYADAMLEEREFFIRKAIGWVLRDHGRRAPDQVYGWLAPRIDRASGVTVKEAVKYLAPGQRERLLEAHRRRRPAHGSTNRPQP